MAETSKPNPRKRARTEEITPEAPKAPTPSLHGGSKVTTKTGSGRVRSGAECPYMDTIDRRALDFDAEAVCSVTLSTRNVYACLVCGRYFQGRAPSSASYEHSVGVGHHLFVNLRTEAVHCLPEQYEVADKALDDVRAALRPQLSKADILTLDIKPRALRLLDGGRRVRGVAGLDNLGATDYVAVAFQLLLCTPPVRDALLLLPRVDAPVTPRAQLLHVCATLARRVWAPAAFRAHIAPHALVRLVATNSAHRFATHRQGDPVQLLAWMLNTLVRGAKTKSGASSKASNGAKATNAGVSTDESAFATLLRNCFQGRMDVVTMRDDNKMRDVDESKDASDGNRESTPFWFLTLDLPPKPLFKDRNEDTLVAQVPLQQLLKKYDGVMRQHVVKTGEQRTYRLTHLPAFLMLTVKRFLRTKFTVEKNRCVVHLPLKNLRIEDANAKVASYSLVAAVIHDGQCENGTYRIAFLHRASGHWYEVHDMAVKKTMSQIVALAETYILLYAKDDTRFLK